MDVTTPDDPTMVHLQSEPDAGDRIVIAVPETVWRRTPDTPEAKALMEPSPCWSAEAEVTFESLMAFFARTWNTPSHIPLEFDPLDSPDLLDPGLSDGDAQVVDALRCLTLAVGEYVVRTRQLNIEQGIGIIGNMPGDFADQLGVTTTENPDQLWFGRQVVRLLDWLRGGNVIRHLEPHLQELGAALLPDVLDFIYLGVAEILRGNDIDEVFGEEFGADVELVAVNENMPGLVWQKPTDSPPN